MNEKQPNEVIDELPEPDAFERGWISTLAEPMPEHSEDADAFVQAVMQRVGQPEEDVVESEPAVIGRIGTSRMRYAAAAAVLLAALVGGYALLNSGNSSSDAPNSTGIASDDGNDQADPQPKDNPPVAHREPSKVKLGQLIASAQSLATSPDPDLAKTVNRTRETLRIENLIELVESPLPDLNELLSPLKPKDQQSRV